LAAQLDRVARPVAAPWTQQQATATGKMPEQQRALGTQGLVAGAQGFGCMGLTAFYGDAVSDEHAEAVLRRCAELGHTLIDTAEGYYAAKQADGTTLFNEAVVGKAVRNIGREKFVVCTKHGPRPNLQREELEATVRKACDDSRSRLGVETIDLYYLHRMYAAPIQIEDVMLVFKELVAEGKIRYVGLSEAPPDVIRRAHAVTPVSAIQQEWSLIARDLEAPGSVVDTCRELGIGIVPYSPVARGFLSGFTPPSEGASDFRALTPYLQKENLQHNVVAREAVEAIAASKALTLSQLSLAWVQSQGVDVVPIPGTTSLEHLEENAAASEVSLSAEELATIGDAAAQIRGERGDAAYMARSFHGVKDGVATAVRSRPSL
jgi:aryl-alcohol dehydrogenase-like predicted oxidoreductase